MANQTEIQLTEINLDNAVGYYLSNGYRIVSQRDNSVQLVKPKKFSLFWGLFWFILAVFPFIIYLIIYLAKKDETIYIKLTHGNLVVINGKGRETVFTKLPSNGQLKRATMTRYEAFHNWFRWVLVGLIVIVTIIIITQM